jgi:TPR repeat protein
MDELERLMKKEDKKVKNKTNSLVDRCKKVVEYGVAKSQYDLCVMYHNGDGVERNYKKAIKKAEDDNFCRICFEHYTKDPRMVSVEAQYDFGVRCYNGKRVEQNYKETFNWFKEVEQNYKEAFNWFKRAAQQGFAPAQYYLGMMHYNGEGVKQNYKEAMNWFKKAAEQGHPYAKTALTEITKILESK